MNYSADKIFLYVLKVFITVFLVYIVFACLYFAFIKIEYSYRQDSIINSNLTILMQPFMEVFGNGKVSHWYDWKNIDKSQINVEAESLNLRSNSAQKRSFDKFSFNITYYEWN